MSVELVEKIRHRQSKQLSSRGARTAVTFARRKRLVEDVGIQRERLIDKHGLIERRHHVRTITADLTDDLGDVT